MAEDKKLIGPIPVKNGMDAPQKKDPAAFGKAKDAVEPDGKPVVKRNYALDKQLVEAVGYRNLDLVKDLIKEGADPNGYQKEFFCDPLSPLENAVEYNLIEIGKALIDAGADVNRRDCYGVSPLGQALKSGNVEMAKLLIERGADINAPIQVGWGEDEPEPDIGYWYPLDEVVLRYYRFHRNDPTKSEQYKELIEILNKLEAPGRHRDAALRIIEEHLPKH